MPPKKGKGARRGRKKNINKEKENELQKFWDVIESEMKLYETHINSVGHEVCMEIRKVYTDKCKTLPENIRNMTLTEYLKMRSKPESQQSIIADLQMFSSQYEKTKLMSEKKKTLKKNRIERKRSMSVSVCSGAKMLPQNLLQRTSRVLSESCLNTPLAKRSMLPSTSVVTPKFNPKVPVSKACMRRPRTGEVVMSLSGSPLLNFADEIPDKPGGVALSLGGGKIIKITSDTEMDTLSKDFAKKLDEDTKQTLATVKEKLDKLLQS